MCMSRHWPPPKYTMEGEEGLPHERQFTIVCSILKYREVGQGKSKKVAKRHAAHKMWQALHDMNNQAPSVDEDEVRTCVPILLIKVLFFLSKLLAVYFSSLLCKKLKLQRAGLITFISL